MRAIDFILLAVIAAAVVLALIFLHRARKKGNHCCNCGENCSVCNAKK